MARQRTIPGRANDTSELPSSLRPHLQSPPSPSPVDAEDSEIHGSRRFGYPPGDYDAGTIPRSYPEYSTPPSLSPARFGAALPSVRADSPGLNYATFPPSRHETFLSSSDSSRYNPLPFEYHPGHEHARTSGYMPRSVSHRRPNHSEAEPLHYARDDPPPQFLVGPGMGVSEPYRRMPTSSVRGRPGRGIGGYGESVGASGGGRGLLDHHIEGDLPRLPPGGIEAFARIERSTFDDSEGETSWDDEHHSNSHSHRVRQSAVRASPGEYPPLDMRERMDVRESRGRHPTHRRGTSSIYSGGSGYHADFHLESTGERMRNPPDNEYIHPPVSPYAERRKNHEGHRSTDLDEHRAQLHQRTLSSHSRGPRAQYFAHDPHVSSSRPSPPELIHDDVHRRLLDQDHDREFRSHQPTPRDASSHHAPRQPHHWADVAQHISLAGPSHHRSQSDLHTRSERLHHDASRQFAEDVWTGEQLLEHYPERIQLSPPSFTGDSSTSNSVAHRRTKSLPNRKPRQGHTGYGYGDGSKSEPEKRQSSGGAQSSGAGGSDEDDYEDDSDEWVEPGKGKGKGKRRTKDVKIGEDGKPQSKRSKVEVACDFCRRRKMKCDGKRPTCGHCKSKERECKYENHVKRRGPGKKPKQTRSRVRARPRIPVQPEDPQAGPSSEPGKKRREKVKKDKELEHAESRSLRHDFPAHQSSLLTLPPPPYEPLDPNQPPEFSVETFTHDERLIQSQPMPKVEEPEEESYDQPAGHNNYEDDADEDDGEKTRLIR